MWAYEVINNSISVSLFLMVHLKGAKGMLKKLSKKQFMDSFLNQIADGFNTLEIEEVLRVSNVTTDTNMLLLALKYHLARILSEKYFVNLVKSRIFSYIIKVEGETIEYTGHHEAEPKLENTLILLTRLEDRKFFEIHIYYESLASLIAPLLADVDPDILNDIGTALEYKCLTDQDGRNEYHLFELEHSPNGAKLRHIEAEQSLEQARHVPSWSSGSFTLGIEYPEDTPSARRESLAKQFEHFMNLEPSARDGFEFEEPYKGTYICSMDANVELTTPEIAREVKLLSQLAKEIKDAGGKMTLSCDLHSGGNEHFGYLRLRGDENGVSARVAMSSQ